MTLPFCYHINGRAFLRWHFLTSISYRQTKPQNSYFDCHVLRLMTQTGSSILFITLTHSCTSDHVCRESTLTSVQHISYRTYVQGCYHTVIHMLYKVPSFLVICIISQTKNIVPSELLLYQLKFHKFSGGSNYTNTFTNLKYN